MDSLMIMAPDPSSPLGIIDVVAVNLQCFGLIILGYFARRFNLICENQTKGLNVFLSYYALPALVFLSISSIPLSQVNLGFVGQIFISKSLIFFVVGVISFILSYKSLSLPQTMRRCSIFAMFCTQSNDFALGYPILLSLYGTSKTSLANYLYILAPIQLLVLNPIALFMFEISQILEENHSSSTSNLKRYFLLTKRILQKIFINPIILSTLLGIIMNISNSSHTPRVFVPFLQSLSQSFSPIALFLLGLNIHGNFKSLKMFSQPLLITFILVSIKLLIMPLLNRAIVQHVHLSSNQTFNETFSEFAFLYGTFPAAPTVYIFSNIYNIETLIVSAGLVISTLLSAPIIFVSTNMIRFSSQINFDLLNEDLIQTIFYSSIISLIGSILLTCSFYLTYKLHSIVHRWSFKILISHVLLLVAGLLFKFDLNNEDFSFFETIPVIQYFLFNVGFFALKLSVSFLSLTLIFLYAKSLCFVIKISKIFFYCNVLTLPFYIIFLSFTYKKSIEQSGFKIDLYYGINRIHLSVSIILSCLTIATSLVSFVLIHHYKNKIRHERIVENNDIIDDDRHGEMNHQVINNGEDDDDNDSHAELIVPQTSAVANHSETFDVEDLYINFSKRQQQRSTTTTATTTFNNEDFKERCNGQCHSQCDNVRNVPKSCMDQLNRYKHNIETAIEAIDMIGGASAAPCSAGPSDASAKCDDFHQVQPHLYLVMFSILIVVIHLSVEVNHLIHDKPNGIYVEIKFLDILLVFSHGFIMFILFGIDADVFTYKFRRFFRWFNSNEIYLPPLSSLNSDTKDFCEQFRREHLEQCKSDITFALNNGQCSTSSTCTLKRYFHGRLLVDWLLSKHLADDRPDAINKCHRLLYGRILEKVCNNKGLDSNKHSLYRNNKPLDLSLSLRYANIPLNSELNLVYDENKNQSNQDLTISVQYEDKARKTNQFKQNDTLWHVIQTLFRQDEIPELYNGDFIFTINYLNKQFDGEEVLRKTTLKSLGINGRVIFRLNSRPKNTEITQKFVENIKFKKIEPEIRPKQEVKKEEEEKEDKKELAQEKIEPMELDKNIESNEPKEEMIEEAKPIRKTIAMEPVQIEPLDFSKLMKEVKQEMKKEFELKIKNDKQEEETTTVAAKDVEIKLLGGKNDEVLYSLDEHIKFVDEDLPEEFFEHTTNDLKHLLAVLKSQQNTEKMLETQEQREKREQLEREKYQKTILRIIFPYDRLVMQALFKPMDTVADVIAVLSKYIHHSNVNLFVVPPKTILPLHAKLYDLKLVPSGIVYCTNMNSDHNSQLIRDEFKTMVTSFSNLICYTSNKFKN